MRRHFQPAHTLHQPVITAEPGDLRTILGKPSPSRVPRQGRPFRTARCPPNALTPRVLQRTGHPVPVGFVHGDRFGRAGFTDGHMYPPKTPSLKCPPALRRLCGCQRAKRLLPAKGSNPISAAPQLEVPLQQFGLRPLQLAIRKLSHRLHWTTLVDHRLSVERAASAAVAHDRACRRRLQADDPHIALLLLLVEASRLIAGSVR
jgi:hypothetical protein